jgi:alkylation response protein AidB-like acyl-CoA dehydrogenase
VEFEHSAEQEALRQSTRQFLGRAPRDFGGVAGLGGHDESTWRRMASELGLQGLAVAESFGGAGASWIELAIVFEEMGRVLLPEPFFATAALALPAVSCLGDDAAGTDLLPAIADGTEVAAFAFAPRCVGSAPSPLFDVRASARGDGAVVVDGTATLVLSGHLASLLLVLADTSSGPALFAVRGDAPGVTATPSESLDLTRSVATVRLASAPARYVGASDPAGDGLSRVLDQASVALAAEQVGGAERCLEMAVAHARTRTQFGRPIGSFQAIKHRCADLFVAIESAKGLARYAAWAAALAPDELPTAAAAAHAHCTEVYRDVAAESLHIHGGTGFTWEHEAHLHLRRAKTDELLFGSPAQHRELLVRRLERGAVHPSTDGQ